LLNKLIASLSASHLPLGRSVLSISVASMRMSVLYCVWVMIGFCRFLPVF
jgi:multidrug transporter EmrE-like cation transporter